MAHPSIENWKVWTKITNAKGGFDWDCEFTCVTSKGTRFPERKFFSGASAGLSRAQLWDAIRAIANAYEAAEASPPAVPVKEFPGRYDATVGTLGNAVLDPANYPPGEAPALP